MDPKLNRQLHWWLSLPTLVVLCLLGFIPIMWPIMSQYEGVWFPVITNIEIEDLGKDEDNLGIYVTAHFDKVRACEFEGISWYNNVGVRSPIIFEAQANGDEGEIPKTRPPLANQQGGPWHLIGVEQLEGSMAVVSHRCHPLWITYTRFYP